MTESSPSTLTDSDNKESCTNCQRLKQLYRRENPKKLQIVVHAERSVISCGRKKHPDRKWKILRRVEQAVSAFMNNGGGHILVHIKGQDPSDRYLEHFDEFINKSFHSLIDDGQLYVDAIRRHWLSDLSNFRECSDFVRVIVGQVSGVATVDFNTRVCSDLETTQPVWSSLARILLKAPTPEIHKPTLRNFNTKCVQSLHEHRHIENKAVKTDFTKKDVSDNTGYIWNKLKLKEHITSKSKIFDGGSYFIGISEIISERDGYKTKTPNIEGFQTDNIDAIIASIKELATSDLSVLYSKGRQGRLEFSDAPDDLIEIKKYPIEGSDPTKYVLEIAIRYFEGIVFYDKQGPLAYTITEDTKGTNITRMDRNTWLDRFENRMSNL